MSEIKFDLQELVEWQRAGNRKVTIDIGDPMSKEVTVWCYDYDLMAGGFIKKSVNELNLIETEIKSLESRIEQLQKKKEGN